MQASARLSSSAASKRVIAGVSSAVTRSSYRTTRGKAHAAPLSAQEPPPKGQKKTTKQERRAKIVEFVDNFRASNDGRFPTITSVRRQAGGSHYTVRNILQELEYNAKLPPGNAKAGPLQEMVEVAEHSSPSDEAKVAQLEGTTEVAENSSPKPEAKVSQLQGASEFTEHSRPKGDIVKNPYNCDSFKSSEEIQDVDGMLISQEAASRTGILEKTETWTSVGYSPYNVETEVAKHAMDTSETSKTADGPPTLSDQTESESMNVLTNKPSVSLREEAKSDPGNQQRESEAIKSDVKNTKESLNAINCDSFKSSEEIQDVDDMLISQEAATRTGIFEKTETWTSVGSSPYNVETEAAKHAMDTSETCKTADGPPTLSDQTESESMNVLTNKPSVSLREEAKSDPGNQQREREANKSDVKNTKESLNASEPSVSDQNGCDKVIEENTHGREHNLKPEPGESANMGLFGSLKSFANGIKNFWRKL